MIKIDIVMRLVGHLILPSLASMLIKIESTSLLIVSGSSDGTGVLLLYDILPIDKVQC
jgi:hypothetical protein